MLTIGLEIFSPTERLPISHEYVIIEGGIGYYDASKKAWRTSMECGDPILQWDPQWWAYLPRNPLGQF